MNFIDVGPALIPGRMRTLFRTCVDPNQFQGKAMSIIVLVIYVSSLLWVGAAVLGGYGQAPDLMRVVGLAAGSVFIFMTVFATMRFMRHRTPADLWKIMFLGILGILGVLPEVNNGLFGLFGLLGFIAYRNQGR